MNLQEACRIVRQASRYGWPAVFEESYLDGMSGPLTYAEIEWLDLACEGIPNFEFQVDMEVGAYAQTVHDVNIEVIC